MSDSDHRSVTPALPLTFRASHLLGSMLGKRFDHVLDGIIDGQLCLTWPDGTVTRHGIRSDQPEDNANVELHDFRCLRQLMLSGEVGFAESYLRGDWSTDSLRNLFSLIMRNEAKFSHALTGSWFASAANTLRHWLNRNSPSGSRRNIAFHYDLGNEFYRLWLDDSMSYSSALFSTDSQSLESAQRDKLVRVRELLDPEPGARVLEIGCGWGAMARSLADEAACQVRAISLSREQLDFACERADAERNDSEVEFVFEDYRDTQGRFDHVVSIEMFEAVGERYWSVYFQRLAELMEQGGSAVLQVITILEERFATYRARPDFIQRYIFPGGMLPSKTHLLELAHDAGLELEQQQWFGRSYALTLERWRERFEVAAREIARQGFDDRFMRMWRYYLSYCEAGFRYGSTDVGLLVLRKS